jgi:hypothetical protein
MRQTLTTYLFACIFSVGWSAVAMGQPANADDLPDPEAPSVRTAADSDVPPVNNDVQPLVDSGVSSGATPPDSPFVEPPAPFGADSCSPNTLPSPLCDPASCTPTRVYVAPYLWVPAVQGTTTVLGVTNDVDVSLGDAFGMLKDLKGAASGHVEIGRGDWTLIMDALLMRFASSADVPLARLDLDASTTFLELAAARRLNGDLFEQLRENGIDVEAIGGVRYYQASVGATLVPNGPILPVIPREQTEEWVDLLVGARVNARLTDTLTGFIRSDFGGFGIGTSSTLTSNLIAGAEYQVNEACLVAAGYRLLDINERQDNAGGVFEFNLRFQGPFAAILFRY